MSNRLNNRKSKEEMMQHALNLKASGKSILAYCRENGVNPSTLHRYKTLVADGSKIETKTKITKSGFVAVGEIATYDVIVGRALVKVPTAEIVSFLRGLND